MASQFWLCQECEAQDLRKFMCFVALGNSSSNTPYAPPNYSKSYAVFPVHSFEPSLWVNKNYLLAGIRVETFERQWIEKCTSFTLSLQYQLTRNPPQFRGDKLKVIVGFGVGNFRATNETLVYNTATINGVQGGLYTFVNHANASRSGFYPRIMLIYKHICLIADYNFIRTERLQNSCFFFPISGTAQSWVSSYYNRSESYFDLKIGYCFYRKKKVI